MARDQVRVGDSGAVETSGLEAESADQPKPAADALASKSEGFPGYGQGYELIGTDGTREHPNADQRFRAEWDEHAARDWPTDQHERGERADRPVDQEGSWRGKNSDRYLSLEQNAEVDSRYEAIRELADDYGERVQSGIGEAHGEVAGYEFRLKGSDQLKAKIAEQVEVRPDRSTEETMAKIPDAIRYTLEIPESSYAEGVQQVASEFESQGLRLMPGTWQDNGDRESFRGVSSQWQEPGTRQRIEVEFHTPASFTAKQLTHEAYERARSPEISREERREIERIVRLADQPTERPEQTGEELVDTATDRRSRLERVQREVLESADDWTDVGEKVWTTADGLLEPVRPTGSFTREPGPGTYVSDVPREGTDGKCVIGASLALAIASVTMYQKIRDKVTTGKDEDSEGRN